MTPTPTQMDALREMVNIGVGQAASVLNAMVHSHIVLRLPIVEIFSPQEVEDKINNLSKGIFSAVRIGFKGPFAGSASLIFPAESAAKLVVLLTEEDMQSLDMDEIKIGTLTEVGNIVLNGVMGAIGNELQQHIYYSVPLYHEDALGVLVLDKTRNQDSSIIWIQTQFTIQEYLIDGDIVILFAVGSLAMLLESIDQALNR